MKAAISGFPQPASSTDKWLLCNAVYGLVSGNGISLPFRCSCHRKHTYFFSSVIFSTKLHKSLCLSKCIGNILLCICSAVQVLHERRNKYVFLGKQGGESKGSRDSGKQSLVLTDSKSVYMYCLRAVLADEGIQNSLSSSPPAVAAPTNLYLNPYLSVTFLGGWGCDVEEFLDSSAQLHANC